MCYHAQCGRSSLKSVVTDRGEPQNWGALGLRPFEMVPWMNPQNKFPSTMCYHVKFGSSAKKGVRINIREAPN